MIEAELPLGRHLSELRVVLVQIFSFIALASLLVFAYVEPIIHLLSAPLQSLAPEKEIQFRRLENTARQPHAYPLARGTEVLFLERGLLQGDTLILREGGIADVKRVVDPKLALFSPASGLMIALKVSLWGGILLSSPFWLIPLIRFITPALYPAEKALLFPFVALSSLFMVGGALLAFYVTLPLTNSYFLSFNESIGMNLWGLENYLNYTLSLIAAHALGFEAAILLFFLVHLKLVSYEFLRSKRRHAIVASLVLGALLTPPDVLSQLLLALPLIGFYELALFWARRISINS